jgi:hypothetical protein
VEVGAKVDQTLDDLREPVPERVHQRVLQKLTIYFHAKG